MKSGWTKPGAPGKKEKDQPVICEARSLLAYCRWTPQGPSIPPEGPWLWGLGHHPHETRGRDSGTARMPRILSPLSPPHRGAHTSHPALSRCFPPQIRTPWIPTVSYRQAVCYRNLRPQLSNFPFEFSPVFLSQIGSTPWGESNNRSIVQAWGRLRSASDLPGSLELSYNSKQLKDWTTTVNIVTNWGTPQV